MIYQTERYEKIIYELELLLPNMAKEVDKYPDEPEPNLNHDEFIELDNLGMLQVVTAREDDMLVGFHISTIRPDIFYKHIMTAYVMFYYMHPDHRGEGKGTGMFEFAEGEFGFEGVKRSFMSRKIYIPNEKLFNQLGYNQIEANYTKYYG